MAYDIGPKIGVDGEAEFRRQLQQVNTSIKTLGSEMKAVTSAFIGQENSIEALSAQNEVLTKTIDAQKDKLQQQQRFLEQSKEKYGDNAQETQKWQRAVNESTAELNRLEAQMRDNERRMEDFGNETEGAGDSLDDAADAGISFGDAIKASVIGGAIVEGIKAIAGAAKDLATELWTLDEATAEYRAEHNKLTAAFKANGHSAETADKAYTELFKVIGDSGEATEASQLLANLAKSTQDVDKWAKIAAGSTGRFGDALPITSLIEAANEAAKTGESVSALDDALNWIGIDAEAFGETLAATATEEERLQLITDTLSQAYEGAADAFYEANTELIRARENEKMMQDASAALGEAVSGLKNDLLEEFAPSILAVAEAFGDMISGVDGADEDFASAVSELLATGQAKLPEFLSFGADLLLNVISGLLSDPGALADTALSIVDSLGGSLIENGPELIVNGILLIGELAAGLIEGIPEALDKVPEIVSAIIEAFRSHKDEFAQVGRELGQALADAAAATIEFLKGKPGSIIGGIDLGPLTPGGVPHANGLNYVPYDGYLAELHKGEMVLTARQAEMMRSSGVTQSSVQSVAAAMVNGLQGIGGIGDTPVNITLVTPEGDALARWALPSFIRVADANGTPIIKTQ